MKHKICWWKVVIGGIVFWIGIYIYAYLHLIPKFFTSTVGFLTMMVGSHILCKEAPEEKKKKV
jgi:hypothetical protein